MRGQEALNSRPQISLLLRCHTHTHTHLWTHTYAQRQGGWAAFSPATAAVTFSSGRAQLVGGGGVGGEGWAGGRRGVTLKTCVVTLPSNQ